VAANAREIIHNNRHTGVRQVPISKFAGRHTAYLACRAPAAQARGILARAQACLGRRFSLLRFNCEHMVNYAVTGRAYSQRLVLSVTVAVLLAGILALRQR
jgi:hypothetical protein